MQSARIFRYSGSAVHAFLIIGSNDEARRTRIDALVSHEKIAEFDRVIAQSQKETSIGIADIRSFIQSLSLAPASGSSVAGIIYDATILTPESQQALLKTLEEPPKNVRIYIGIDNATHLLPTILSRCDCIYLADAAHPDSYPEVQTTIETLLASSPGTVIHTLSAIGKTKEDLLRWLEQAIEALRYDLLQTVHTKKKSDTAAKQALLHAFLEVLQYQKNNVSLAVLVEHAFFSAQTKKRTE